LIVIQLSFILFKLEYILDQLTTYHTQKVMLVNNSHTELFDIARRK
jgi:hypothetical protein